MIALGEGSRGEMLVALARRLRRGLSTAELRRELHDVAVREVVPLHTFDGHHHTLVCQHAVASVEADVAVDRERALPVLWAAGLLHDALRDGDGARDIERELPPLPPSSEAERSLASALEAFDGARARAAVAALCRSGRIATAAKALLRAGSRDFREIGHKMIHVVEGSLRSPRGADTERCLRSVALTLCLRDEPEGYDADGPFRANSERAAERLEEGRRSDEGVAHLLAAMRIAAPTDAAAEALALRRRGASALSVLDAVDVFAAELMFNNPTSVEALHAVTSAHADRTAMAAHDDPHARTLAVLQAVSRVVTFRDYVRHWVSRGRPAAASAVEIETMEPVGSTDVDGVASGFGAATTADRVDVARRALAIAGSEAGAEHLLRASRRRIPTRAQDVHDFKLATAVKDVSRRIAPAWRARYVAACSARLCGDGGPRWDLADTLMEA
jgi:hypothetical protein